MVKIASAVSTHSKEIAKGAFWTFAGQAGMKLVGFFYLILLARMATQENVGTFYLALSILGVFSVFGDLGLSSAFIRYVPYLIGKNEFGKLRALLKGSYSIVTALSVVLLIAIFFTADFFSAYFHNPTLGLCLKFLSPYILLNMIFSLNLGFLNGQKLLKDYSTLLTFQTVAKFILTLALFLFVGTSIFPMALAFVLSFLAALLLSFFYIRKPLSELPKTSESGSLADIMKEVIPFGLVISIINSLWLLITYTDRILIGYMIDPSVSATMVAVYSMATNMAMLIMIFPTAISTIFFPLISGLIGQGKKEEITAVCETSSRWIIFITFPLTLVMLAFSDNILRMFYGDAYAVGALTMAIFTFGLFIRSLSSIQSLVLAGMRMLKLELYIAAVTAAVNIALNIFLIPKYGIVGAAVASAISFMIATIMFQYYSWKLIGFKFPSEGFKALVAGILALGIILIIKPYLTDAISSLPIFGGIGETAELLAKMLRLIAFGILFLISGAIYIAILFALKSFHKEDVGLLDSALKRARVPEKWASQVSSILAFGIHEE